jgi:hypothetical protein
MMQMPNLETEGWFSGHVAGQKMRKNEKSGAWSLNLTLEVDEGECRGQHAWWDAWLTIKALDKTMEKLARVFGYDGGPQGLAAADFVGKPIRWLMESEEYNGKTTIKVKAVTSADAGGAFGYQPPKADDFNDFLHSVGADPVAAPAADPNAGAVPSGWGEKPADSGSDLPF